MSEGVLSPDKKWIMQEALELSENFLNQPVEEEKSTRYGRLKQRAAAFFETFTVHGLFQIYNNQHIVRKLIWFIVFGVFFGYALYQCNLVVKEYSEYPTLTSFKVKYQQESIDFPAVTLCNLNPLNTKEALREDKIYGSFIKIQEEESEPDCEPNRGGGFGSSNPIGEYCSSLDPTCQNIYDFNNDLSDSLWSDVIEEFGGFGGFSAFQGNDYYDDGTKFMDKEIFLKRIRCSFIFQFLVHSAEKGNLIKEDSNFTLYYNGITLGNLSQCTYEETLEEKVGYVTMCQKIVFWDNFGFYFNVTHDSGFTDHPSMEGYGKISCAADKDKYHKYDDVINTRRNEKLSSDKIRSIIQRSKTDDLGDGYSLYSPAKSTLVNISRFPSEFIESCSMNAKRCTHMNFHEIYTEDYGFCYTFNSPHIEIPGQNISLDYRRKHFKPESSYLVGPRHGLRVTIDLKSEDYVTLLSPNIGLRVTLHDPWEAPFPRASGFNLAPGLSHSVAISRTLHELAPKPHGKCVEGRIGKFSYSIELCFALCLEKLYRDRCGCKKNEGYISDMIEDDREIPLCNSFNLKTQTCMIGVQELYNSEYLNCDCEEECTKMQYDTRITSTVQNYDFLSIIRNIKGTNTGSDVCSANSSVVRLHLYMDSAQINMIKETPTYTWTTLISNMGGNLGLFVGLSLISLMEVADLLLDVILIVLSPDLYDRTHSNKSTKISTTNGKKRKIYVITALNQPADEKTEITKEEKFDILFQPK